jgi:membrane associated rhomboid family serine protease
MRIKYNAPTTLTFAFFCTLVVALDQSILHGLTRAFFTVPNAAGFDLANPLNYVRLFTHIAGHADWNHLISNLAYVLLLGPMLEETYGSLTMFLMMIVTGFVTGVLNACFFPNPLLGASGVVFMMILLASFTNHGADDVPLTFIVIVILYLGREILNAFRGDDISQFAHLAGGLCGSLFGFFQPGRPARARAASSSGNYGARVPQTSGRPKATKLTIKGSPKAQSPARQPAGTGTQRAGSSPARRPATGAQPRAEKASPDRTAGKTANGAKKGTPSTPTRKGSAPTRKG